MSTISALQQLVAERPVTAFVGEDSVYGNSFPKDILDQSEMDFIASLDGLDWDTFSVDGGYVYVGPEIVLCDDCVKDSLWHKVATVHPVGYRHRICHLCAEEAHTLVSLSPRGK